MTLEKFTVICMLLIIGIVGIFSTFSGEQNINNNITPYECDIIAEQAEYKVEELSEAGCMDINILMEMNYE